MHPAHKICLDTAHDIANVIGENSFAATLRHEAEKHEDTSISRDPSIVSDTESWVALANSVLSLSLLIWGSLQAAKTRKVVANNEEELRAYADNLAKRITENPKISDDAKKEICYHLVTVHLDQEDVGDD